MLGTLVVLLAPRVTRRVVLARQGMDEVFLRMGARRGVSRACIQEVNSRPIVQILSLSVRYLHGG